MQRYRRFQEAQAVWGGCRTGEGVVGRAERCTRGGSARLARPTELLHSTDTEAPVNEGAPLARKDLAPSPT